MAIQDNVYCIIRELLFDESNRLLVVGYLYFGDNNKGKVILLSLLITAALDKFCGFVIWNVILKELTKQLQKRVSRNTNSELGLEDMYILEEHHVLEGEYVNCHDSQSV